MTWLCIGAVDTLILFVGLLIGHRYGYERGERDALRLDRERRELDIQIGRPKLTYHEFEP